MAKVKKVPALSVVSQHEGFRRTDRAWSKTPTIVKISDLSEDEIKQIKGEPMLIVTEIKVDEEESTAGSEQGSDASAAGGEQGAEVQQ